MGSPARRGACRRSAPGSRAPAQRWLPEGGRIGGVLLSFYVTLCSKKKHKNKKRKRDEDAEEQLDIVGEQLSGNYVILWQL